MSGKLEKPVNPAWCKHHRNMIENETCLAGVRYDTFAGVPHRCRPCAVWPGAETLRTCEKAEYATPEEIAAEEAKMAKRAADYIVAKSAILEHLGPDRSNSTGSMPCPVCHKGELRFRRAPSNGHIHAKCSTDGCVGFLE